MKKNATYHLSEEFIKELKEFTEETGVPQFLVITRGAREEMKKLRKALKSA